MRETANASIDFTGVPHLLARPSKGEPNGVVVWSEIQPLVDSLSTKLDLAHLKIEQQKNNAAIIKRFALTGGVAEVKASPEDGENYTYTTFTIPTGFVDNAGNPTVDFEDFAMSAVLQPFANEGFRYEFHKEAPDHAVVVFQNIAGAFPDDRVRISLILIPEPTPETPTLQLNSQGTAVSELQGLLKSKVSPDLVVDGTFGASTENAVKAIQSTFFLDSTGVVDANTWQVIRTDQPIQMPVLSRGSKSSLVQQVQILLSQASYNVGTPDGDFGAMSEAAITAFQNSLHLAVSQPGVIDQLTWKSLVDLKKSLLTSTGAAPELNPTDPNMQAFKTNFSNWVNWDGRFGAGTWDRLYRGITVGTDGRGVIHFANGNSLSQDQIDGFFNSQNLGAVDAAAGATA